MLNRAARYFPILREISSELNPEARILEIGSGPIGIGEFFRRPFVGCDLTFATKPKLPMRPVMASGVHLPFANGSFEVVIASDVLEHVPVGLRVPLVTEALRVCRRVAVFAFPCGDGAHASDRQLLEDYRSRDIEVPKWLLEHMEAPFPEPELFQCVDEDWVLHSVINEGLEFHKWLMRREMNKWFNRTMKLVAMCLPPIVERMLRNADTDPSYRMIFVLRRGQA